MKFRLITTDMGLYGGGPDSEGKTTLESYPVLQDVCTTESGVDDRSVPCKHTFIEIESLSDLTKIAEKTKQPLIISMQEDFPTIEIYDAYRE